jgi:hypothetical protein
MKNEKSLCSLCGVEITEDQNAIQMTFNKEDLPVVLANIEPSRITRGPDGSYLFTLCPECKSLEGRVGLPSA